MINVIIGPAAIAVYNSYWIGVASGNCYCSKKRRTPEAAIKDAEKKERGSY